MPRLPWLLGPYWPMVDIDAVIGRFVAGFFISSPASASENDSAKLGPERIVGRVGLEVLPSRNPLGRSGRAARIFRTLEERLPLPKLPRQSPTAKSATAIAGHADCMPAFEYERRL